MTTPAEPVERYKSFSDFAADLLGPWAGFFTGWTYWFCWIVTGIADVIAISGYFKYWWPGLAAWIPALLTIAALLLLNLPTVRAFGETEFWFALIKIIAIVSLIVVGIVVGIASSLRTPSYRASARVLLRPSDPSESIAGRSAQPPGPAAQDRAAVRCGHLGVRPRRRDLRGQRRGPAAPELRLPGRPR